MMHKDILGMLGILHCVAGFLMYVGSGTKEVSAVLLSDSIIAVFYSMLALALIIEGLFLIHEGAE